MFILKVKSLRNKIAYDVPFRQNLKRDTKELIFITKTDSEDSYAKCSKGKK